MLFTAGKHLKWDVLQTSGSDCVGGWGVYCLFKQLAFCFKLSQCTHQMPALRYISTQMVPYNYFRASCQVFRKMTCVHLENCSIDKVAKFQALLLHWTT